MYVLLHSNKAVIAAIIDILELSKINVNKYINNYFQTSQHLFKVTDIFHCFLKVI